MHYFKHTELQQKYHVSLKTIHNWIDAAKSDKLKLKLQAEGNRTYIANTPANLAALDGLVQKNKKYRNTRFHKTVKPLPFFYDTYDRRQILEIASSIDLWHELPFKYSYFDGGAEYWEKEALAMEQQSGTNALNSTLNLIKANLGTIDLLLEGHQRINVVDIGVGNARPVKDLLAHLLKRGVLNRYIAIDISQTMLDIAERNVRKWFGNDVQFEGHVRDIDYERFDDLLLSDILSNQADQTINLVLLFGGTAMNQHSYSDVFRTIHRSMGVHDLFLYTGRPDTEASRRYFEFSSPVIDSSNPPTERFLPDVLGIDPSLYEVELGYDEKKRRRFSRGRLKTALTIKLQFDEGERNVLLEKDDTLLLWHVWHLTSLELISELEQQGFKLLQAGTTKDRQYMLTIFGLEKPGLLAS